MTITVWQSPVHIEISGQGEPALFLHGNPDSAEIWTDVIAGVQQNFQCFAPDCPGYRNTPVPSNYRFDLDGYADWVNALLDALEIDAPITLVIHDWGGIMGMCFAAKYPQRVKRVIGGDFPFSADYRWHRPWAQIWRTPVLGELSLALMNWPLFQWEMRRGSRRLSQQQLKTTYNNIGGWASRKAVLAYYRSANPEAYAAWQSKVAALAKQVPIHLLWGAEDYYVPLKEAQRIPHATLEAIDGCGHWLPLEAPDAYIRRLIKLAGE